MDVNVLYYYFLVQSDVHFTTCFIAGLEIASTEQSLSII